jgi:hypothetical protein
MKIAVPLSIVGCRMTEHGLLIRYSDNAFYLFTTEFLVENRVKRGDRIPNTSPWLADNWKSRRPK